MDFFAVLNLPPRYGLDLADAERRFREASRQVHPDRFARADPRARRASLQRTVQLNEAWRTLRDPVRRAEYLLRLAGYDIGGEDGASRPRDATVAPAAGVAPASTVDTAPARDRLPVPPALLGEILELREELSDARAAGDDARVQAMARGARDRVDGALARVAEALARAERSQADRGDALEIAARDLIAIRYFRRFLDEVSVHDEVVAAAAVETARHA
ncbi:MAG: Fe-S protein assembly co-chaperone HscB [Haliangium ochraceum]